MQPASALHTRSEVRSMFPKERTSFFPYRCLFCFPSYHVSAVQEWGIAFCRKPLYSPSGNSGTPQTGRHTVTRSFSLMPDLFLPHGGIAAKNSPRFRLKQKTRRTPFSRLSAGLFRFMFPPAMRRRLPTTYIRPTTLFRGRLFLCGRMPL